MAEAEAEAEVVAAVSRMHDASGRLSALAYPMHDLRFPDRDYAVRRGSGQKTGQRAPDSGQYQELAAANIHRSPAGLRPALVGFLFLMHDV